MTAGRLSDLAHEPVHALAEVIEVVATRGPRGLRERFADLRGSDARVLASWAGLIAKIVRGKGLARLPAWELLHGAKLLDQAVAAKRRASG